jgi:hypothetical protein
MDLHFPSHTKPKRYERRVSIAPYPAASYAAPPGGMSSKTLFSMPLSPSRRPTPEPERKGSVIDTGQGTNLIKVKEEMQDGHLPSNSEDKSLRSVMRMSLIASVLTLTRRDASGSHTYEQGRTEQSKSQL